MVGEEWGQGGEKQEKRTMINIHSAWVMTSLTMQHMK